MADILVLGATGFTGRLIVEYLTQHPERSKFTFAIAARSPPKLEALRKSLGVDDSVKSYKVDVMKQEEIDDAVKQVKVVLSTVGPYHLWGTPVVAACVRHGKHYVDLSGETHWAREIIDKFDYYATKTRSIIIPSSGFDSIPSDIAVYLSNQTIKSLSGPDTGIEHSITGVEVQGGFSGGTFQTIFTSIEEGVPMDRSLSILQSPSLPMRFLYTLPFSSPTIHGGLWVLASGNQAVVQRTWSLHEPQVAGVTATSAKDRRLLSYGPRFKYEEFYMTPNKFGAILWNAVLSLFVVGFLFPPTRWLLKRILPASGEGPSEKAMKNGFFKMINVTTSDSKPPVHARTTINGRGDPGYSLTAVMISECALSLVLNYPQLTALAHQGGILTPISALGEVLVNRLTSTGRMDFHTEPVEQESRKTR